MKKRLYVAYGSNLNVEQMAFRCPTAKLYGTGVLENYALQFKGSADCAYATIAPKDGSSVPVAVWEIQPKDEKSLDRYEGHPSHYFKKDVPVQLQSGEEVNAMVYIMNLKMDFGMPSKYYYRTVHQGYLDCGLDTAVLALALKDSIEHFYSSAERYPYHQMQMVDDPFDDYDLESRQEEEQNEADPFYVSDGMKMGGMSI